MSTHEDERQQAHDLGLDDEVLRIIKASVASPLSRLTLRSGAMEEEFDDTRFTGRVEPAEHEGEMTLRLDVLAAVIPQEDGFDVVASLQPQLQPRGCQALVTAAVGHSDWCQIFDLGVLDVKAQYDEQSLVVFFPAEDYVPLLWVRQTNGVNCGVYTKDVIERLDDWAGRCSFAVLGAGWDWVELSFRTLPDDLESFAEEVVEFCPDTIDQAIVKAPPEHLAGKSGEDLSEDEMEEMMEFMEGALDEQDASDLADFLAREKRLFLWWD
jgi:hypothetical protein